MKTKTIIALLIVILFTGCTITQEYHFNNDFSGTYSMDLDMGDFINMMKSMDTTGNMSSLDSMDQSFGELSEQYKNAGATNVETGWKNDKTTMFIKFDFADLDGLNKILKGAGENSDMLSFTGAGGGEASFINKGKKKLFIDLPEYSNDTASMEQMDQMKEYLSFETIFSFDREIKDVDNENALISGDKKSFKFEGSIDDFMKEDFSMDTNVKLKRK